MTDDGYLPEHRRADGTVYVEMVDAAGVVHEVDVGRCVLETFVGPQPPGLDVVHLNGDPTDNRLVNLAWGHTSARSA